MTTSAFLSEGLLLQTLHVFAMFLMEHHSLGGFVGPGLANGIGTGSLSFFDRMAPVCLGFHNCHVEIVFGLQD